MASIFGIQMPDGPLALAMGFFDGVHVGHRAVLGATIAAARAMDATPCAITFTNHPRSVLSRERQADLLTSLPVRIELLKAAGMCAVAPIEFTAETAGIAPRDFIRALLSGANVVAARCGADWRFGAKAAGDVALLKSLGREFGFDAEAVPPVVADGAPVSSTRIREAVADGRLDDAAKMLGRPHALRGTVEHGRELARKFALPTANIVPGGIALPPVGVYATLTSVEGGAPMPSATSLGWRPTFDDARPPAPIVETHVLGFSGDLYGKTIDVSFIAKIRDEMKFPSPEALFAQIRMDAAAAEAILGKRTS